jgi:hypothetical protein
LLLFAIDVEHVIAQPEVARVEVFGGYSLLPADGDDFPRQTSHGVHVTVSANVTPWFGVFGDIGAQFNTATNLGLNFEGTTARTRVIEYLAGPRFTVRSDRAALFVHGLIGLASGDAGDNFRGFSDTKLAFGGGGGVDVGIARRFAVRAQFDLLASFADIVEGNTRFGVGVVAKFGGL